MGYKIVSESDESTVVTEYIFNSDDRDGRYESEAELEDKLIKELESLAYEYIDIDNEEALIKNIRVQLEKLNDYKFTDTEWQDILKNHILNDIETIVDKAKKIHLNDDTYVLYHKDGSFKNIKLIDRNDFGKNHMQVINQYKEGDNHRYDVTILINGLPMVHIELKRRGVSIKDAFNQIKRYQRNSFSVEGNRIFEYIQLFIISNGTETKYYSNTIRERVSKENERTKNKNNTENKKTSNSFEFTSYWTDEKNNRINDLLDFARYFLYKTTILNIITKYCVFNTSNILMVMRPYQIVATEKIINKIKLTPTKDIGTINSGGYIWHTTGSGKTLTSFKTAQLATKLDNVDKVIFVVDRKDLDYQTMQEYNKFQEGAANGNTSTKKLTEQIENEDEKAKIIVTTIQKLNVFINKNPKHKIYSKNVVMIFDECHRSQFGAMHTSIIKKFKNYYIFGFTGTPIFPTNASSGTKNIDLKTTEQAFGKQLHNYTIINAIKDNNVLPFKIEYHTSFDYDELNKQDSKVETIDTENALMDDRRIKNIVNYIINNFDRKTYRNQNNSTHLQSNIIVDKTKVGNHNITHEKVKGFNSIFATSSIPMAMRYYVEFKKQLKEKNKDLKIGIIYSYKANEEDPDDLFLEESLETDGLDKTASDFLKDAIDDYNEMFGTSHDTSGDGFQNYFKELSGRVKNQEIDLLIVVNMFLTGFDATTLNTLWVDKQLQQHGLIQAYSRTNRILNSIKSFGNIVCFRNLEKKTNEALALFGENKDHGIIILKNYEEYEEEFTHLLIELKTEFPLGVVIHEKTRIKHFISLFSKILRLRNILMSFDQFNLNDFIQMKDYQDYQSMYIGVHEERELHKERINDDLEFEMELIKQVDVDTEYILNLVKEADGDKEIAAVINRELSSNYTLRSKKDLINKFIKKINNTDTIHDDYEEFKEKEKKDEIDKIIQELGINDKEAYKFIDSSFKNGYVKRIGTSVDPVIKNISMFKKENGVSVRKIVKEKFLNEVEKLLERFD